MITIVDRRGKTLHWLSDRRTGFLSGPLGVGRERDKEYRGYI